LPVENKDNNTQNKSKGLPDLFKLNGKQLPTLFPKFPEGKFYELEVHRDE